MSRPSVSICLLCYNQRDLIGQTIQCAINQTSRADEILVVDDCSKDDSVDVITQYPEVTLLRHSHNLGRSQARNTLLSAARGDILVYIDGDAFADASLLSCLLSEYGTPTVGGVGGQGVEANLKTTCDRWRQRHATQAWPTRLESAEYLWGLCMSYRRLVLTEVGGFRGVGEDLDIARRIRRLGYRLVYTPAGIVYHQRTDDFKSLRKMVYRWWYGGYIVDVNNGTANLRGYVLGILKDFQEHIYTDLVAQPAWELVWLDFVVMLVQLWAVVNAVRSVRKHSLGH